MRTSLLLAAIAISASIGVQGVWAQSVLSAKSGTIHHVDGKAWISGVNLKQLKTGEFPALEIDQVLATENAHAEVLLSPGVFLRLGENSEVKLLRNQLTDTAIQLLKGSALVEAGEVLKGTQTTVLVGGYRANVAKVGLYRFDADPDRIRVFDGRLEVNMAADVATARPFVMKKGRQVEGGQLTETKFDAKSADELFAWSRNRSALVAMANASAARSAGARTSYRSSNGGGAWLFLPSYGLYTFMPGRGYYASPFGFNYYSPAQYYAVYYAPRVQQSSGSQAQNSGGFGVGGGGARGGGFGGSSDSSGGAFGGAASSGGGGGAASSSAPARSGGSMPSGGSRR